MKRENERKVNEIYFNSPASNARGAAKFAVQRAEFEKNYTRCFSTTAGSAVLQHLRQITIERFLEANATEAELRTLEAQRALIHQIETLIERGK
jgi:hypothetical protein